MLFYLLNGKMERLKEIVKEHRRLSGLSQAGLARLAGVGKTVVFDLEHGKQSVRLDTLRKILAALNISLDFDSPVLARRRARETSRAEPSA
jgi:HTH-type transcriptional regulator / antitoxin HipB